jgi:hypothetical protein
MLPKGYMLVPPTPLVERWYLRSPEEVMDSYDSAKGPRYVASSPKHTPRKELEEIAWMDYEIRQGGGDTPEARAKLSARFPQPILPKDPLLDERGKQIRMVQR